MPKEQYAFDLDELKSLVSQITAKKMNETLIEDFNNTYELSIDILSPKSLYQAAESIQKRVKKKSSLEPGFSKANLINQWHLGEKTLLFCTIIYYLALQKRSIQSITENDLLPLKKIFLTKDISLLSFEAKHLLEKTSLKKSQWRQEDIRILIEIMMPKKDDFMRNERCFKWKQVAYDIFIRSKTGEFYSAKECRQKWINHLNPQLVKSTWSLKEDVQLFIAINDYGCKWALISKNMGGLRTEHMIKNRANALMKRVFKKKVKKIEKKHINLVIQALRDEEANSSEERQNQSPLLANLAKKDELFGASYDTGNEVKMEMVMEDFLADVGSKQVNLLDFDDTYSRLVLIQNVEEQWQYNEEGHSFDLFAANKFNYSSDLDLSSFLQ